MRGLRNKDQIQQWQVPLPYVGTTSKHINWVLCKHVMTAGLPLRKAPPYFSPSRMTLSYKHQAYTVSPNQTFQWDQRQHQWLSSLYHTIPHKAEHSTHLGHSIQAQITCVQTKKLSCMDQISQKQCKLSSISTTWRGTMRPPKYH